MIPTLTFAVTPDALTFAAESADGGPSRTLSGQAVPLGVPSDPSGDGHRYQFDGPPTNIGDLVDVVRQHDPEHLIGRLAEPFKVAAAGLDAVARLFRTTAGDDALTEAIEGARASFSIGASIAKFTEGDDGVRHVTEWTAEHLGLVRRPAFATARVATIHATAHTTDKEPAMPETITPPATTEPPAGAPAVVELPTVAELAAQVAEHLTTEPPAAHPLAAFGSFDQFVAGFRDADDDAARETLAATFAVPDQTTPQNPGLMPPAWRTEIKMRLDSRRPAITAFGGPIGLPSGGMESNWPYLDPTLDLDAIIAQQTAEKAELPGVPIRVLRATEPIKTAGTVSDISYQLLMRGTPSYHAAYLRICLAAWARFTEARFEGALVARGTDSGAVATTAAAFKAQLFEASADVEDATGAPADVVLVDPVTWVALGGMPDLQNSKYGTQNVAGTSSAATLRIDVNGLNIVRAPFLPADTMVVSNSDAAKFPESGPRVASQEDVRKLGRDVAVWGMWEDAEVYYPAGVRVYGPAAP